MQALSEDKNRDDMLRELEIQSILDESHSLADQEQMKKNAQKYRAKPKMADIFSNADQKPRLKNKNPLEPDDADAEKADITNTIVGDKTATTMKAELIMDGSDEIVRTPQEAVAQAKKKAEEEKALKEGQAQDTPEAEAEEDETEIITLKPEYAEDTRFSGEVLGEVDQFKEEPNIESIHSIDIDMDDEEYQKSVEEEKEREKSQYEKLFGIKNRNDGQPPKKVVAKVPVYRMTSREIYSTLRQADFPRCLKTSMKNMSAQKIRRLLLMS